jgi:hypothetical protein
MNSFDRSKLNILPLALRENKSCIENIIIDPDNLPSFPLENDPRIEKIAKEIVCARQKNKPVILAYGAHLVKNGLGLVLRKMIQENIFTHLATNGAGSIHDWEFAFQGKSEEDVAKATSLGQFGLWQETGKYLNLAIISGAKNNKGYGESISEMIHKDFISLSNLDNEKLKSQNIPNKDIIVNHPYKKYSIQEACFNNCLFTVHPCFGQDIIYTHPLSDGASIGKCAEIDFLKYVDSVSRLEQGVYLSVGSAIMSPMIFEKSLSMARNLAIQKKQKIDDFLIVVNDIQPGNWDWNKGEPPKENPAYYLRFCKTFNRMKARELQYIQSDNREFIISLYKNIKKVKGI